MQLEVGALLSGTVTGITKYGVFVDLGSDKTGMVHISEVASTYVKEISDHVRMGQQVAVKVIGIDEKGRISLSMKQAEQQSSGGNQSASGRQSFGGRSSGGGSDDRRRSGADRQQPRQQAAASEGGGSFDDMLKNFMQSSNEKMSELRRGGSVEHRPRRRK